MPRVLPTQAESPWPFRLVLLSLVFEFGRPQEIIPGLKVIPFSSLLNAAILVSLVMNHRLNFKNIQTKLWVPLLGVMVVHLPLAVNRFYSVMTLKDMGLLFCLYSGLIAYVTTLERMKTLVSVWVGVHVIAAVLGIAKGGVGVGGWMGDENDFCMTINMALPFAFFMSYATVNPAEKFRYLGLMAMYVLTVTITLSRGGFIGMVAVGIYSWFRSPMKIGAILVVAVLAVFVLIAAPAAFWEEIGSSFSNETMEKGTGGDRLYIWGIGFEMFLANPVIGVGQGNFPWTFEEYEQGRTFNEASRAGRAAHSLYFSLLAEMGLVGGIVFALFNLNNYRNIREIEQVLGKPVISGERHSTESEKARKWLIYAARSMEGAMIGFLVSSVFISTTWYPSFWVMSGFIVALRNLVVEKSGELGVQAASSVTRESSRRKGPLLPRLRPLKDV
ncbi:MAG: O-antigen ligase family protein [Nitrospiraceae bacterium]